MSDKKDVILPWVELQDLLMYFQTTCDEKAVAMLRNLTTLTPEPSATGLYTKEQLRQFGDWLASRKDIVTGREIDAYIAGIAVVPSADKDFDRWWDKQKSRGLEYKGVKAAREAWFEARAQLAPIIEAEVQRRMADANRQ